MNCCPVPSLEISALSTLIKLRRLEFLGCRAPTLLDFIGLIPHLKQLEQLDTGNMTESRMEERVIMRALGIKDGHTRVRSEEQENRKSARGKKISLPMLRALQISSRPLSSWLIAFTHIRLPSLTRLTLPMVDFQEPSTLRFFHIVGPRLAHLYTKEVRTSNGLTRLLALCPDLQHLTISPDHSYHKDDGLWRHINLRSIGLHLVVPTNPQLDEVTTVAVIKYSTIPIITHIANSCIAGGLPMLETVRMEDRHSSASKHFQSCGEDWVPLCNPNGLHIEDAEGHEILYERVDEAAPAKDQEEGHEEG
jgi:hypothetical protein